MNRPGIGNHLFLVLSDPSQDEQGVIIVGFSTLRGGRYEDHSYVIDGGVHPKLPNQSWLFFRDALSYSKDFILEYCPIQSPLSEIELKKAAKGADASDYFPQDYRQKLVDQGIIE